MTATLAVGLFFVGNSEVQAQETLWVKDETNQLTKETLDNITYLNEEVFPGYDIQPQIGVEILKEMPDEYYDMDEYKNERFEELGIGSKEHDSGILYVIAIDDREFGIETGYGIEPIVRDVEAQQVLDDTIDHMVQYSDTGEPEHLNNAVNQAVSTLETLLEKGNTGVLFEERAEQERIEKEQTAEFLRIAGQTVMWAVLVAIFLGLVAFVVEVVSELKRRKRLREMQEAFNEQKRLTAESFTEFYESGNVPFKEEYGLEEFLEDLNSDSGLTLETLQGMTEDKIRELNKYRMQKVTEILNKVPRKNDVNYYTRHTKRIGYLIEQNPTMKIAEALVELDDMLEKEVTKRDVEMEKVQNAVAKHLEDVGVPDYLSKAKVESVLVNFMANRLNLTDIGVKNLTVKNWESYQHQVLEEQYKRMLVHQYLDYDNRFNSAGYGRGSKNDFKNYAENRVGSINATSKDLVDGVMLYSLLTQTLGMYVESKEDEYVERKRQEKIRREREREEERERQRRHSAMSSYTSSSSSSGGGFGGGFGGGSSGGGGASGGW